MMAFMSKMRGKSFRFRSSPQECWASHMDTTLGVVWLLKRKLGAILVWFFLLVFANQGLAEVSLTPLVKRIQPSVATIITYDMSKKVLNQGTGFFINGRGHLITNFHVLRGAHQAEVRIHDGTHYPIKSIVSGNADVDLIEVLVDIPETLVEWIEVTEVLPQVAEPVLVIGSPMGLEHTVSEGIVSAIRRIPGVGTVCQISAPISSGSSGRPVINMKGEVVGVATFQLLEGQNLNFAVPGKSVNDLRGHRIGRTFPEWADQIASQRKGEEKSRYGRLFVETVPQSARVRILNIKPKFHQGIQLEPGQYHVEVSAEGYKQKRMWVAVDAGKDKRISIRLERVIAESDEIREHRSQIESFTKLIRDNPNDWIAYLKRAHLYGSLGSQYVLEKKYRRAIESLQHAIEDSSRVIENRGKDEYAVFSVSLELRANGYNRLANTYANVGQDQETRQYYSLALEDCERSEKLASNIGGQPSTEVFFNRGVAHNGLKNHLRAIRSFNKAIQIDPTHKGAYQFRDLAYNLYVNTIYLESGGAPDAPFTFEKYPTQRAAELEKAGKYNEVIDALDEAVEIDSEDCFAYRARGYIHGELGNIQESLRDLNKTIELNPKEKEAYCYRGGVYHSAGNYEQAIRDCSECIQRDPENSAIKAGGYVCRGYSYYLLGEYDRAAMDGDKAVELNPASALAYRLRGLARYRLGMRQQAIRDVKIAARFGDDVAQNFLRLKGIGW